MMEAEKTNREATADRKNRTERIERKEFNG